jgi:hypothetical protein
MLAVKCDRGSKSTELQAPTTVSTGRQRGETDLLVTLNICKDVFLDSTYDSGHLLVFSWRRERTKIEIEMPVLATSSRSCQWSLIAILSPTHELMSNLHATTLLTGNSSYLKSVIIEFRATNCIGKGSRVGTPAEYMSLRSEGEEGYVYTNSSEFRTV